jgi:hypothetical protein
MYEAARAGPGAASRVIRARSVRAAEYASLVPPCADERSDAGGGEQESYEAEREPPVVARVEVTAQRAPEGGGPEQDPDDADAETDAEGDGVLRRRRGVRVVGTVHSYAAVARVRVNAAQNARAGVRGQGSRGLRRIGEGHIFAPPADEEKRWR